MKNRWIAFLLVLAMLITGIPVSAEEPGIQVVETEQLLSETPAEEIPAEEKPAEETPADEIPADETPAEETPAEETPADEIPADETLADEIPANETLADETPADEIPADVTPAEETPADEIPADETPADETPSDEIPVEDAPAEETPADETPVDEIPADETPAEETPVDEAASEEIDYTKYADDNLWFEKGYAMADKGAKAFDDASASDAFGEFKKDTVVYVISRVNIGESKDRLKVAYALEDGIHTAFVSASKIRPLSEEEVSEYLDEEAEDAEYAYEKADDEYPLALISFELYETEEPDDMPEQSPVISATPDEIVTETATKDEAEEETPVVPEEPEEIVTETATEDEAEEETPVVPEEPEEIITETATEDEAELPPVPETVPDIPDLSDGSKGSDEKTVIDVASVSIQITPAKIGVGEKAELIITAFDSDGNETQTDMDIVSSMPGVAEVNETGLIVGKKAGTAVFTATAANGVSANASITVMNAPSSITLSETVIIIGEDSTKQLTYTLDNGSWGSVEWKSGNELVVTVDDDGTIQAVGLGAAAVQVRTYNGLIATCAVTVMAEPNDIILTANEIELDEGESATLQASFTGDTYGVVEYKVAEGDDEIVIIDLGGNKVQINGVYNGEATVIATVQNHLEGETYTAQCVVTVNPVIASIAFKNERRTVGYKERMSLEPVAYDARGNEIATTFTYKTSKSSYVSVNAEGVYGARKGSANIHVVAANGTASNKVKITTVSEPSKVTVSADSSVMLAGDTLQMKATIPSGQAGAVKWISEFENIASVDPVTGVVTAHEPGTVRIKAQAYNGKSGMYTITVTVPPTAIRFASAAYSVDEGAVIAPELIMEPAGAFGEVEYTIEYTDEEYVIASVSEGGDVSGITSGEATLKAAVYSDTLGGMLTAETRITVVPAPFEIVLKNERRTIGYRERMSLDPVAYDVRGNEVETTFTYKSSKTSYITVNASGAYGYRKGTASVKVIAANGVESQAVSIKVVSEPSKVTISNKTARMQVGATLLLSATLPSGQAGAIKWISENDQYATVDPVTGEVKAIAVGTVRIKAEAYNGKNAICTLTITEPPVAIAFPASQFEVAEGASIETGIIIAPEGSFADVKYEITDNDDDFVIATVDDNGVVTGVASGVAHLKATVYDEINHKTLTAMADVTVTQAIVKIDFLNERRSVGLKERMSLEPVAYDGRGNVVDTAFTYKTSSSRYVSVNSEGVYGAAKGSANVHVVAENGFASEKVKITTAAAPTKVTVSAAVNQMAVGDILSLKATLPSGQAGAIEWFSEDDAIASVDPVTGAIAANGIGTVRIKAQAYNNVSGIYTISVKEAPEAIVFAEAEYTVYEGQSVDALLVMQPAGSFAIASYEISDNDEEYEIASVDAAGKVTGHYSGEALLTATVYNAKLNETFEATAIIHILPSVNTIEFKNDRRTIGLSERMSLEPVAYDARGNEVETTFTYKTSKSSYVSVNAEGVYGARKGTANIHVVAANGVKSKTVSIKTVTAPSKVTLNQTTAMIRVGDTLELTAKLSSGQAGSIKWISEFESIATVDEKTGLVQALDTGVVRIKAQTYNGKSAICTVTVFVPPTSVAFTESGYTVYEGEKITTNVVLGPDGAYGIVSYEIKDADEEYVIASVDADGVVTGNVSGKATLKAVTYNDETELTYTAETEITVLPAPCKVELLNSRRTIGRYETMDLEPVAYDGRGNVIETTFKYKTSKSSYVSISNNCVYGKSKGSANIQVVAENGVASDTVKITTVTAPSKISLKNKTAVISETGYVKLVPVFASGEAGAVSWTSANPAIAEVDANGVVYARSYGDVEITVKTYNGKTAKGTVSVRYEPTGVAFDVDETLVGEKGTKTLLAKLPENCAGSITYTSTNPYVATVNSVTGLVTGIRQGKAKIVATTINNLTGETFTDTYDLTVTPEPVSFKITEDRRTIGINEELPLNVIAYDEFGNVTEGSFTYSSNRTKYGTVNAEGVVLGKYVGYTNITVKTYNGLTQTIRMNVVKAPGSVKITAPATTISEKDTLQLKATTNTATTGSVTWESSEIGVATVDAKTGYLTAVGFGETVITAISYNGRKATVTITVKYEPTSVSFDSDTAIIGEGAKKVITAKIPEDCFGPIVYASLNPTVATVDPVTGQVTALSQGECVITATVQNRNFDPVQTYTDECTITVTPKPVKIVMSLERTKIGLNEIMALNPVAIDADGNETDGAFTYASSRSTYVKVNAQGEVNGLRKGYSDITIRTYNGVSIKGRITVVAAPTSIKLDKTSERISEIGTLQLTAKLGGSGVGAYTWASDNQEVCRVDQNGLVTAVQFGTAKITATTYNGRVAECLVKVCYEPVSIEFENDSITVGEGDEVKASATLGDDYIGTITYVSLDPEIAKVDAATGVVTGVLSGETKIIATARNNKDNYDVFDECVVTVTPAPARVEILTTRTTIGYRETMAIEAVSYDARGNLVEGNLKLKTSKAAIVKIIDPMKVYGEYYGTATIRVVAYNDVFASINIKVVAAPTSVKLNHSNIDMIIGNPSVPLTATINSGSATTIVWEVENPEILEVDQTGRLTALAYGTTRVKASAHNGKYALCTVNVYEAPQSVTLDCESMTIGVGETRKLTATLNEKAAGEITWESSDSAKVSVDNTGKITAKAIGSATITATTFNGKTDSCLVTVIPAPKDDDFKLSETSITIGVGQTYDINQLIELADGVGTTFSYAHETPTVASIDAKGLITAKKAGTARVAADTHNGIRRILTVNVKAAPSKVTVSVDQPILYLGETATLTITLPNGILPIVRVESADPEICRVESDLRTLTAVGIGKTTITVTTYNNKTATINMEIRQHVESIELDRTEVSIVHYDELTLVATVLPETAFDRTVTWSSSDDTKVSVDDNGRITAVNITDTPVTITATTNDSRALTATCLVTVTPVRVQDIRFDTTQIDLEKNREMDISSILVFTPANADNKNVSFISSQDSIISVSDSGVIKALGHEGNATITATSEDGGFTAQLVVNATRIHAKGISIESAMIENGIIEIVHYEETTLSAVLDPADTEYTSLEWNSDDDEIVAIDSNGKLTAESVGEATVSVMVTDYFGDSYSAIVKVRVLPVRVESVELSVDALQLRVGASETIQAIINPANADDCTVVWETDASRIVTISEDDDEETLNTVVITAGNTPGNATVKVTTNDGAYTDSINVTVLDALRVKAESNHHENNIGNDVFWTITSENVVGDALYSVEIMHDDISVYSSDGYVAQPEAKVTDAAAGTYVITVMLKDSTGEVVQTTDTVVVKEQLTVVNGNETYAYTIMEGEGDSADNVAIKLLSAVNAPTTVTVPANVYGMSIVRIDTEAFMNMTTLTSVSLPDTVEVIGARAFKGCTSLTTMTSYDANDIEE